MIKPSLVVSALLVLSASAAYAADTSTTPATTTTTTTAATSPATTATPGSQGAASVQKNLDADKSGGKATKGLNNAEAHITANHGKARGAEEKNETNDAKKERAEKPVHVAHHDRVHVERPAKPERPGK
jgi:hypothetical protein